jgi:hypothetical protein
LKYQLDSILKRILCKFIGYYENGQTYLFDFSVDTVTLKPIDNTKKTPKVLVISRENYREKTVDYPVVEQKPLKKLLSLEYGNINVKYIITDTADNKSSVNVWHFNENLPKSTYLIPETFLFQHSLAKNQVMVKESTTGKLYVSSVNRSVISIIKSAVINSTERFCMSAGLGSYTEVQVPKDKVASVLLDGAIKSNKQHLLSFFSLARTGDKAIKWLSLISPAIILTSVYLLLSSMWLFWDKHTLEQQFQERKAEMVQALNIQDEYLTLTNQLQMLEGFISTQKNTSSIWLVLSQIIDDTNITVLRYDNARFTIIGTADQATTLMEKITNLPQVADAQFDMPTRKIKELEYYRISFTINHKLIEQGEL